MTRPLRFLVAAALAGATGASPAAAYDLLGAMVARLPAGAAINGGSDEWYFMAPDLLIGRPVAAWPGVAVDDLTPALLDANVGLDTVGIDFTRLAGILNYGGPQALILYLSGDGIEPEAVGTALLTREGMARADTGGFVVFAEGEDNALDFDGRDEDYPFGMHGVRGHRVAVIGGAAIVTNDTASLVTATEAFASEPASFLRELVEAAATAAPQGIEAFGAAGLPQQALFPDAADDAPYFYALLIASSGVNGEAAQVLLALPSVASIQTVAPVIAARLEALRADSPGKIVWTVAPTSGGPAAIITLAFPPGTTGEPAAEAYQHWLNLIFRGDDLFFIAPP